MVLIPGDHGGPLGQRDRADKKVRVCEALPPVLEKRLGLAKDLDGGLVEPKYRQGCKKTRDDRAVPFGRFGFGGAVIELRGGDPRGRAVIRC